MRGKKQKGRSLPTKQIHSPSLSFLFSSSLSLSALVPCLGAPSTKLTMQRAVFASHARAVAVMGPLNPSSSATRAAPLPKAVLRPMPFTAKATTPALKRSLSAKRPGGPQVLVVRSIKPVDATLASSGGT